MWFQTLKTRQTVKKFTSTNSNGQMTALEYSDRKVDVHMLKRETSPLSLDDVLCVGFVSLEDGSVYAIGVSMCGKGRAVLEFKAWDVMNALGFTSREIIVQDMERLNMNEGKFKAIVNLPEPTGTSPHTIKIDSLLDYLAVSMGPGLVLLWKCRKTDSMVLSLELVTAIMPSIAIHDITLVFQYEDIKSGFPCLVLGGTGGVQIFVPTKNDETLTSLVSVDQNKFTSTFHCFQPGDLNNISVQDLYRSSLSTCILSDNSGGLWFLTLEKLSEIHLPSSVNDHGIFAVQMKSKSVPEGWLATVQKNQTLNLYKLDDVIKMTNTGLIVQPWHVIFSSCQLNCVSFIDVNTLAAGSSSNRTLSLWSGLDCIGK